MDDEDSTDQQSEFACTHLCAEIASDCSAVDGGQSDAERSAGPKRSADRLRQIREMLDIVIWLRDHGYKGHALDILDGIRELCRH